MSNGHDPAHEEVLRDVALGERAPTDPEVEAIRAGCADCRAALGELAASLEALRDAGEAMRADLEAAERATGAPGEERIGAMLARARAAVEEARPSGAPPGRRSWLGVAAALALATVVWLVARAYLGGEPPGPTPLGPGLECVAPVGEVDGYGAFGWRGDRPPAGWFEVVVRDADGAERLRSGRLEANEYRPAPAELEALPDAIRWEVVARDVGRVHDRADAEARRR